MWFFHPSTRESCVPTGRPPFQTVGKPPRHCGSEEHRDQICYQERPHLRWQGSRMGQKRWEVGGRARRLMAKKEGGAGRDE